MNTMIKCIFGEKTPNEKKKFIRRLQTYNIEPWISKGNFDIEEADILLDVIQNKQDTSEDIFVLDVYRAINLLIEGAYVSGLNDAKDMSAREINRKTRDCRHRVYKIR